MLKLLPHPVVLPTFEGPLDLLLQLIERNQLDITEISLALVTDQYLQYVVALDEPDPDMLAAFLVIAAKLLLIKSRALLPQPPREEVTEDVGRELAQQLIEYRKVKEAAAFLRDREQRGMSSYLRPASYRRLPRVVKQYHHKTADLLSAVQARLKALEALPEAQDLPTRRITVPERATEISIMLASRGEVWFDELLEDATSRVMVIVTFLAILELLRRREAVVRQDNAFGAIVIALNRNADNSDPHPAPATPGDPDSD